MLEQRAESGQPTKLIDERVDPCEAARVYWEAFRELSGQRPISGMGGAGEMRYEVVTAWLDQNDVTDAAERARFRSLLHAMDLAYLEDLAKKITPVKGKTL